MGVFDWKHWLVLLLVVVLIFGTKKLKGLGTDVGTAVKGFRESMQDDCPDSDQPAGPRILATDEHGSVPRDSH